MASYTAHQYELQRQVGRDISWSGTTGKCPVCRVRPCGVWADGKKRITCGNQRCFIAWLPVRGETETGEEEV